jgi:hypothetical protein
MDFDPPSPYPMEPELNLAVAQIDAGGAVYFTILYYIGD